MIDFSERERAGARFRSVFSHLPAVVAYARRRGSRDAEAIAAGSCWSRPRSS
jgi:hypothetical protein